MAKPKKTTGVPSVLCFSRKLEISDAVFASANWADRHDSLASAQPVIVREKSVRGTIGNRFKTALDMDPTKIDASLEKPNLQKVDIATLPVGHDTLKVSFTIRVLGDVSLPSACSIFGFRKTLTDLVQAYQDQFKFKELARRYVINLANGRFLWRNGIGASACEVSVHSDKDGLSSDFEALDFSLANFEVPPAAQVGVDRLTGLVSSALCGEGSVLLTVTAFVRLGAGQEVFPSQELILDKDKTKDKKSRTLYVVENGVAGMHSQKLGNAIRTIDDWHPAAADIGPIAVEMYGAVTTMGTAFRQPQQKIDFFSLFDKWCVDGEAPSVEQQHYVIAVLIRGGVFGASAD